MASASSLLCAVSIVPVKLDLRMTVVSKRSRICELSTHKMHVAAGNADDEARSLAEAFDRTVHTSPENATPAAPGGLLEEGCAACAVGQVTKVKAVSAPNGNSG